MKNFELSDGGGWKGRAIGGRGSIDVPNNFLLCKALKYRRRRCREQSVSKRGKYEYEPCRSRGREDADGRRPASIDACPTPTLARRENGRPVSGVQENELDDRNCVWRVPPQK